MLLLFKNTFSFWNAKPWKFLSSSVGRRYVVVAFFLSFNGKGIQIYTQKHPFMCTYINVDKHKPIRDEKIDREYRHVEKEVMMVMMMTTASRRRKREKDRPSVGCLCAVFHRIHLS